MVHIDTYSLIYGICIGSVGTTLILIGAIIRDIIDSRRQTKREVRKAHDEGFTAGRKRRGYEKLWMEAQVDAIKEAIRTTEKAIEERERRHDGRQKEERERRHDGRQKIKD